MPGVAFVAEHRVPAVEEARETGECRVQSEPERERGMAHVGGGVEIVGRMVAQRVREE